MFYRNVLIQPIDSNHFETFWVGCGVKAMLHTFSIPAAIDLEIIQQNRNITNTLCSAGGV